MKGKVYKTVVRPALLYGLGKVELSKRQEAELEVAEVKIPRFSLGEMRMDWIRTKYIKGSAQVKEVSLDMYRGGIVNTSVEGC